ncbi:hypothetical protein [Hahella ganghwensis]|uniref:hypothetical protein n=1 Tax=Hahella ganghwensis TaxID=286420 RepID=UPI000365D9A2|nr:hypothetical protein [Hahella ganghwensis]
MKKVMLAAALFSLPMLSNALEEITGKVTLVESSYMPGRVTFAMDKGSSSCPAGGWMTWKKDSENNKAVHATLMAALMSGKKIRLYVGDGDTSCNGMHIHLLSE